MGCTKVQEKAYNLSLCRKHLWVPRNLPQMLVRVLEVPRIAAIERILSRLDDQRPGGFGLGQYGVNLSF